MRTLSATLSALLELFVSPAFADQQKLRIAA